MLYIILGGRWCDIIVLNIHAPAEDKIDDMKDSFYEELEHVFDKFPRDRRMPSSGMWRRVDLV
jgi:hypothetical protein